MLEPTAWLGIGNWAALEPALTGLLYQQGTSMLAQRRRLNVGASMPAPQCRRYHGCPLVGESGTSLAEYEANAAAADEADDGRHAYVDVPPIEGEGGEGRHDLGDDCVDDHLQPAGAGGQDRLNGPIVYPFNLFREQLS